LQDTTAEIRVRGAFLAGTTLKLVDRDRMMTHAFFHRKLEAAGFGVFVPPSSRPGLLSVIVFPLVSLILLRATPRSAARAAVTAL